MSLLGKCNKKKYRYLRWKCNRVNITIFQSKEKYCNGVFVLCHLPSLLIGLIWVHSIPKYTHFSTVFRIHAWQEAHPMVQFCCVSSRCCCSPASRPHSRAATPSPWAVSWPSRTSTRRTRVSTSARPSAWQGACWPRRCCRWKEVGLKKLLCLFWLCEFGLMRRSSNVHNNEARWDPA